MKNKNLIRLPTNALGENYTDAVRRYGKHYGSAAAQIDQAVGRAELLVSQGHSPAMAVETARKQLHAWSKIKGDDATFQARKRALARGRNVMVLA